MIGKVRVFRSGGYGPDKHQREQQTKEARRLIQDALFWIDADRCGIIGGSWAVAARKWLKAIDKVPVIR